VSAALLSAAAVGIGAGIGALARWQLSLWLSTPGALIPWGTLAANVIGGYLIGVAMGVFLALPELSPLWRLLLVTGFLGGLTTFSAFSAEVLGFLTAGRLGLAMFTALAHVSGSLLMTWLGLKTVHWLRA
jgi:CrcB protein